MHSSSGRVATFPLILLGSAAFMAILLVIMAWVSRRNDSVVDSSKNQGKKEYETIEQEVAHLLASGRKALALRAYKKFPSTLLETEYGRKILAEAKALDREISDLFDKDMAKIRRLLADGKDYEALAKCQSVESYTVDPELAQVLKIQKEILARFDAQVRDAYLAANYDFRNLMQNRNYPQAAQRIVTLLESDRLPAGLDRQFLFVRSVDYSSIKSSISNSDWNTLIKTLLPMLQMYESAAELETSKLALVDILTTALASTLLQDAQRGTEYFARQSAPFKLKGKEGSLQRDASGAYTFVAKDGSRNPLNLVELDEPIIAVLAQRGAHEDQASADKAAREDALLQLKIGILFMYSGKNDLAAEAEKVYFPWAHDLKLPMNRLYLDILTDWKKRKGLDSPKH